MNHSIECINLEACPKCGEKPNKISSVWRIRSVECECGNSYGGIIGYSNVTEKQKIKFFKTLFQQWNNGAREEKGLPKEKCKFKVLEIND